MPITVKDISEIFGKDVFTNKGAFSGKVVDVDIDLAKFRIKSMVIEATKGGFLSTIVGGKKGVVIPYSFVENIGDVVIIKHINASSIPTEDTETESTGSSSEGIVPF